MIKVRFVSADGSRVDEAQAAPGARLLEVAQANGWWTLFDSVEDLIVPPDLAAALDAVPEARAHWDAFPASPRKMMLGWLVTAAKEETRRTRITAIVEKATNGERAQG